MLRGQGGPRGPTLKLTFLLSLFQGTRATSLILQRRILFLAEVMFYFISNLFFSMVLLRIPTAVQPMTGIEGFKYQASDG